MTHYREKRINPSGSGELIRTEKLGKVYENEESKTPVLFDVDFILKEGEYIAVIGPSGSGKSTFMQILGCLDRPTSGKYFFEEREINTYGDDELAHIRNDKIGFVFQAFNLLPRMTVSENVELPLIYAGISPKTRKEIVREKVELVELSDRADFPVTRLSGGQKQRVAIARALVRNPKIIFADEPTGNLDSKSGEIVLDFFQKLNREQGVTIMVVTHESYVAESAERIIHIFDGRIKKEEIVEKRRIISMEGFKK